MVEGAVVSDENEYACKLLDIRMRSKHEMKKMIRANRVLNRLINNIHSGSKNTLLKNQYALDLQQLKDDIKKEKKWLGMSKRELSQMCNLWTTNKKQNTEIKQDASLKSEPIPEKPSEKSIENESKSSEPTSEPLPKEESEKSNDGPVSEQQPVKNEENQNPSTASQPKEEKATAEPEIALSPSQETSSSQTEPLPRERGSATDDSSSNSQANESTDSVNEEKHIPPPREVPPAQSSQSEEEVSKNVDENGMPLPPMINPEPLQPNIINLGENEAPINSQASDSTNLEKEDEKPISPPGEVPQQSEEEVSKTVDESGMPLPPNTRMDTLSTKPSVSIESPTNDQVESGNQNIKDTSSLNAPSYSNDEDKGDEDKDQSVSDNSEESNESNNQEREQSLTNEFGLEGDERFMVRRESEKVELYQDHESEVPEVDYDIDLENTREVNH